MGSRDGSLWQSYLEKIKFLLSGTEDLVLVVFLHAGTQPSPERSIPGFSSPSVTILEQFPCTIQGWTLTTHPGASIGCTGAQETSLVWGNSRLF